MVWAFTTYYLDRTVYFDWQKNAKTKLIQYLVDILNFEEDVIDLKWIEDKSPYAHLFTEDYRRRVFGTSRADIGFTTHISKLPLDVE